MTVSIAGTWTGGYAPPAGFTYVQSATTPAQVTVANAAGDWMIAAIAWQQPVAGAGASMCASDDAHNWWEPVGAPSADSSAAGLVRCSVWAAPAARAAAYFQACPTAPVVSLACAAWDVTGIGAGWAPQFLGSASSGSGTSLTIPGGTVAAQSLVIAVFGSGQWGATVTPPAGWTALTGSTIEGLAAASESITVSAAYKVVASGATGSAAWSASGPAVPLAGVMVAIPLAAAVPSQKSPNWPAVITEAAIGSGPQSDPAAMTWTDMSARALELQVAQGKQYTLGQLAAAQGTITLDNQDGALIPPGTGSFAGIDSGTPLRRRCYWPGMTPWYIPFSGFFRRWPFAAPPDTLRGQTAAEISDIWAYASGSLNSMAREELLIDSPYAVWPLDDSAGAPAGSNIAPANSNPLALVTAKLGAGGATQQWGANSGALLGDTSATNASSGKGGGSAGDYQLTLAGTSQNTNGYGYALVCYDQGFPSTSAVTVEGWFLCNSNQNTTGNGFFNSGNTITVTGSSFANGTPVVFSGGSLPTGMTAGTVYYVISQSGATFQISASVGGSAVTLSTNGSGFCATTNPWNPHVVSLRNATGLVAEVDVRNTDGALLLYTRAATGITTQVVLDTARDWRLLGGLYHLSLALTSTTWRVMVNGGSILSSSGTMSAIYASWNELALGGVIDRSYQGYCMAGQLSLWAVYPYVVSRYRTEAHYWAGLGLAGDDAHTRIDRVLGYAGIAGRRWIGQQGQPYEVDTTPSGQDIGGQSAATSVGNVASSTVPGMQYVAPSGDIAYLAKQYAWNQPVKWTLGDNTAGGEIPFSLAQFATDYDPTRVYNDVQLTELDTSTVTVPNGIMSATTMAAQVAASQAQYGDQPYQQTAYLNNDYSAAYAAGSGLQDLADWIALVYGKPRNRVPAVQVDAASHPAAWPLVLQASPGDMVQVNLRLPTATTSPIVSVVARITQTRRAMKWTTDETPVASIGLALDAAPEYQALICDDPVRGALNGTNVLAW